MGFGQLPMEPWGTTTKKTETETHEARENLVEVADHVWVRPSQVSLVTWEGDTAETGQTIILLVSGGDVTVNAKLSDVMDRLLA